MQDFLLLFCTLPCNWFKIFFYFIALFPVTGLFKKKKIDIRLFSFVHTKWIDTLICVNDVLRMIVFALLSLHALDGKLDGLWRSSIFLISNNLQKIKIPTADNKIYDLIQFCPLNNMLCNFDFQNNGYKMLSL